MGGGFFENFISPLPWEYILWDLSLLWNISLCEPRALSPIHLCPYHTNSGLKNRTQVFTIKDDFYSPFISLGSQIHLISRFSIFYAVFFFFFLLANQRISKKMFIHRVYSFLVTGSVKLSNVPQTERECSSIISALQGMWHFILFDHANHISFSLRYSVIYLIFSTHTSVLAPWSSWLIEVYSDSFFKNFLKTTFPEFCLMLKPDGSHSLLN